MLRGLILLLRVGLYALAWVWLSRVRNWQTNVGAIPRKEGRQAAREAIERALALDPNLAEAHIQMGRIRHQVELDWTGGDTSFQRTIALEPGNPEALRQASLEQLNLDVLTKLFDWTAEPLTWIRSMQTVGTGSPRSSFSWVS